MSFIPITSLLNGVLGSGYLSHAINLYLHYKPPLENLQEFFEFQIPRQWAPLFGHLPLSLHYKQPSMASLQFSISGPTLYVNTNPVDVGKRPVMGIRLYLEGEECNRLAIHLQHLSSLPNGFHLEEVTANFNDDSNDPIYYNKVQSENFSHVCTAPIESTNNQSIVTGAQLHVQDDMSKKVLFLRLYFSKVLNQFETNHSQWAGSSDMPQPQPAIYAEGLSAPVQASNLLKFVDTTEMTWGPPESPGYWVITGARLLVDKGKISLLVKYSLPVLRYLDEEEGDPMS